MESGVDVAEHLLELSRSKLLYRNPLALPRGCYCTARRTSCVNLGIRIADFVVSANPRQTRRGGNIEKRNKIMLNWALTFLIVALIAAIFGFTGVAGTAAWIAQVLFVVFLVLFLVSALTGAVRRPPVV